VIFSYTQPLTLKELAPSPANAFPRIIARITFSVKGNAPGGLYSLGLKDGIGNPANFNRFTSRGTSITPRLVAGSFRVSGGNVLTLDKKLAIAGATPSLGIFAYAQHPDPLGGFQVAFTYEKNALTLPDLDAQQQDIQNASYNLTTLGFELGASKIELFNFDVDINYSPTLARTACAVLFDYVQPYDGQTLRPATTSPPDQSLLKYTFRVEATADDQKQWQDLTLDNSGVPGLVDNRFIIGDQGVDPALVNGKIYFSQGNLIGRIIDTDRNGVPGAKVVTDPDGFEATTNGNGEFRMDSIIPGKYTLLVSKVTAPPSFYQTRHFKTQSGADIVVEGSGRDSATGDLVLYPVPRSAGVTKPFLRGHINGDAKIDLSDAVALVLYLFRGGAEPTCLLAADANDDNKIDISDSVYMLTYLFKGGPKPAAPFSLTNTGCAEDPTKGGNLGCLISSCPD
jgi:hypothetical protein